MDFKERKNERALFKGRTVKDGKKVEFLYLVEGNNSRIVTAEIKETEEETTTEQPRVIHQKVSEWQAVQGEKETAAAFKKRADKVEAAKAKGEKEPTDGKIDGIEVKLVTVTKPVKDVEIIKTVKLITKAGKGKELISIPTKLTKKQVKDIIKNS